MSEIRKVKTYKKAKAVINDIYDNKKNYFLIHYSCESFYGITDGKTPRVTSIAIKSMESGQVTSFSIHKIAEQKNIEISTICDRYNELEKEVLQSFGKFVKNYRSYLFIHWNMRDINYGFEAIRHRAKVLGVSSINIDDKNKIDLAKLLKERYGEKYTGHPRLETLLIKNDIKHRHFLSGNDEAGAFDNMEYIKLHQSTLAKVESFSNIINLSAEGRLKTDSNIIRDIYGSSIQSWFELVNDNWAANFIFAVIGFLCGLGIDKLLDSLKQ